MDSIERVQNAAARWVCKDYNWSHSVSEMKRELHWKTMEERQKIDRLCMMFRIRNELICIPKHQYTRDASYVGGRFDNFDKLQSIISCHEVRRQSFFVRTPPEWNSVSYAQVLCGDVHKFRESLLGKRP